jgi:hypothetical protein
LMAGGRLTEPSTLVGLGRVAGAARHTGGHAAADILSAAALSSHRFRASCARSFRRSAGVTRRPRDLARFVSCRGSFAGWHDGGGARTRAIVHVPGGLKKWLVVLTGWLEVWYFGGPFVRVLCAAEKGERFESACD